MQDFSKMLGGSGGGLGSLIDMFDGGRHDEASDEQVTSGYGQVAANLPQDPYLAAAQQAFERLSPEQRAQFAQQLQAQAGQHGVSLPPLPNGGQDAGSLAQATGQVHAQQPNVLQQMFAPGGTFSNPIAKMALLGITAMAAKRLSGGR